ncbi:PREDICTED: uncharacterized protein LOC101294671 [Fragaria vesca subsp. vesca]
MEYGDVRERYRDWFLSVSCSSWGLSAIGAIEGISKFKFVTGSLISLLEQGRMVKSNETKFMINTDSEGISESERELKDLKEQPSDACPVGPLIKKCCTLDQGNAVATFLDAILNKALRTVALRAARGRGKSAALCYCCRVIAGYSNIFVIALNPENLKTLFEFVCKGLDALDYKVKYLSIPMGGKDRQMIVRQGQAFMPRIKTGRSFTVESMCDFTEAEHMQKNLESSSDLKAADETKADLKITPELKEETIPREAKDENSARQAITVGMLHFIWYLYASGMSLIVYLTETYREENVKNATGTSMLAQENQAIKRFLIPNPKHCSTSQNLVIPVPHIFQLLIKLKKRPGRLTLTRPKEPEFETSQRVRSVRVKSTAELEEEMMAKIPKFKARPVNKKILEAPSLPAMSRSTPQPPAFQIIYGVDSAMCIGYKLGVCFGNWETVKFLIPQELQNLFSLRLEHNNISGELVSLIYCLSLAMVSLCHPRSSTFSSGTNSALDLSGKTIGFRSYKSEFPPFPTVIGFNQICEILPHRFPFLLVDREIEYNPSVSTLLLRCDDQ